MGKLTTSFFRNRIEDHLDEVDLDVICRKRKSGYALYWEYDREPIAKLHPTGSDDKVEIFSWEDDRWRKVQEQERTLSLDEALEYITDDPDDLFFSGDDDGESVALDPILPDAIHYLYGHFVWVSTFGGAVGGMFSGAAAGFAGGALSGILVTGIPNLLRGRIAQAMGNVIVIGIPALVPAAVGGALGGSLHAALGSGIGWLLCSAAAGFLCSFLVLCGRFLAWVTGLAAGMMLGMRLVLAISPASDTVRFALVSVVAAASASASVAIARWHIDNFKLTSGMERSEP